MADLVTAEIITGILESDSATKQALGQKLATHLRFEKGPSGRDDGIDGIAVLGTNRVLFQVKLRSAPIGADEAKIFWADLLRHRTTAGVYLAGRSYSEEFRRVSGDLDSILRNLGCEVCCFLLTLEDVFDKTDQLRLAAQVLPPLAHVDRALRT